MRIDIETLGSFAAVWLILWVLLALALRVGYVAVRPALMRLHPSSGSALLLALCAVPLLFSLAGTILVYLPADGSLLIEPHCHDHCAHHAPVTGSSWLIAGGLTASAAILILLIWRGGSTVYRSLGLQRQLTSLSRAQERGYRELDSDQPLVFTLGWLRPDIYVSRGLRAGCASDVLGVMLHHERAHRRRLDNLRMLAGRLMCLILPGPLKARLLADLHLLGEQACDFAAARAYGELQVAETIILAKRLLAAGALRGAAVQHFTGSETGARVEALIHAERRVRLGPVPSLLLVLMAAGLVIATVEPLHHGAEWLLGITR